MPQLTFTACLTGLLILLLFMIAAIYFEGAPFDRLPTLNNDWGLKWGDYDETVACARYAPHITDAGVGQ